MTTPSMLPPGIGSPLPNARIQGLPARDCTSATLQRDVLSYGFREAASTTKMLCLMPLAVPFLPLWKTPFPQTSYGIVANTLTYGAHLIRNGAVVFLGCVVEPFAAVKRTWDYATTEMPSTDGALDILDSPESSDRYKVLLTNRLFKKDYSLMGDAQQRRLWQSVLNWSSAPKIPEISYQTYIWEHRMELRTEFPDLHRAFKMLFPLWTYNDSF